MASCTALAFKSPDTQGHFLLCLGSMLLAARVQAFVAQPEASRLYQLAEDVAVGKFTIRIAKTLPLDQIREVRREAAEGALKGKLVLTPG